MLSFELSGQRRDREFRMVYKGKLSGNSLKGTVDYKFGDREGTRNFVGHREAKE